jgi:general secretion pathway protein D
MKNKLLLILLAAFFASPLEAQVIPEMAFNNAEITDVLLALSNATGKSILPDETVKGPVTYSFKDKLDFEKGLQLFLSTYKMYYRVENGIYYISRISAVFDAEKQTLTLDAEDVELVFLVRAVSKAMNVTVMDESMPSGRLTVHAKGMKAEDLLSMLVAKFPDYAIEKRQNYFLIKRLAANNSGVPQGPVGLTESGGRYSINIQKVRFKDLLTALFTKAGLEYQNFSRKDQILEDLRFSNKTFEEMLRLILDQMSMDYQRIGDIYYLFEIAQNDVLKNYKVTKIIPLVHLSIQDFQKLLPAEYASSKLYKFDENTNSIILNGTLQEIGPIQEFIKKVDKPADNLKFFLYTLNYLDAKNIKAVIPPSLRYGEPLVIPNSNSFLIQLTAEKKAEFDRFIAIADIRPDSHFIQLRYIKSEDLMKSLPPSVVKENLFVTGDPSGIFFIGSDEKFKAFQRELEMIDRPIPQIQYKILVIQYDRSENFDTSKSSTDITIPPTSDPADPMIGKAFALTGQFGSIYNLAFDILGDFGVQFATNLNVTLSTNKAKLFADTTLNGVSGQELKFQNTDTRRFVITEPVSGSEYTTSKQIEISFGLTMTIKGWISGDGMISMDVNATVSKQNSSDGSTTGELPGTSEKVVTSHVRSRAGVPVVIGGLIYQNFEQGGEKVPVLGDLPLLGLLFQKPIEKLQNTEMVIYIVPVLQFEGKDREERAQIIERYYDSFVQPLMEPAL